MARTRSVGLLRLLSVPLFACHVDACLYECGAAAARRFEASAVYVPGIIIISSWMPSVLEARAGAHIIRLATTVCR